MLKTGYLFVALAVFSDGSPIDKQMKHSEHPCLLTMLNLTLEGRKKVDGWNWVSLLPEPHIEVSDLEKQMNNKFSGDESIYTILLQDFYCCLSKIQTSHTIFRFMVLV